MKYLNQSMSHLFEICFITLLIKSAIYGIGFADAFVLLGLMSGIGLNNYIKSKEEKKQETLEVKVLELSNKVDALSVATGMRKIGNK